MPDTAVEVSKGGKLAGAVLNSRLREGVAVGHRPSFHRWGKGMWIFPWGEWGGTRRMKYQIIHCLLLCSKSPKYRKAWAQGREKH